MDVRDERGDAWLRQARRVSPDCAARCGATKTAQPVRLAEPATNGTALLVYYGGQEHSARPHGHQGDFYARCEAEGVGGGRLAVRRRLGLPRDDRGGTWPARRLDNARR